MPTLKIVAQAITGKEDIRLSPFTVALTAGDFDRPLKGSYVATVSLLDIDENIVNDRLGGNFNVSGRPRNEKSEFRFTWDLLTIRKVGKYQLVARVLELATARTYEDRFGTVTSEVIDITE